MSASFNPLEQPTNMVEQSSQNSPDNSVEQQQPAQAAPAAPSQQDPSQGGGIGQGQSQPTPADAKPVAKPQSAIDQHQSMFRSVLEGLGGGPTKVTVTDPNTGEVHQEVRHMSKGNIGASILAGAISGMLAGAGAPNQTDQYGHQDLSGSAKAGADAGNEVVQKRQQKAQDLQNTKQTAAYQVVDHNLKMHSMIMANTQMQGEVMKQGIATDAPVIDAMMKSSPGAIAKQNVSEQELQKMMADKSAHVTRDSVMRDGVTDVYDASGKQVMNADGTPRQAYTYTIYDPTAMVALSKELKDENPEQFAGVPVGSQMPLRVLAKFGLEKGQMQNATQLVSQWNEKSKDVNPKFKDVDLAAAIKKDPYLKQIVPMLGKYAGKDPDEVLNDMEKNGVDPNLVGRFANLFQVDRTKMAQQRAEEVRKQKVNEQVDEAEQKSKIDLKKEKDLALYKKGLGIVDSDMIATKPFTNDWADANGNHYDLTSQPVKLVEGTEDPTQLSKKSKTYDMNIKAADAYSYAKYGKPFDMAKAQIDYKEAQNPTVRSTLRYLNSLTGDDNKSGNLGDLVNYSNKFNGTTFKSINDVKAWAQQHANDTDASNYATAIVETSDQVAKILQGGGSGGGTSDAKLKQAEELFNRGFSAKEIAGVADTLRGLLSNRKTEMIRGNRYLEKQFSDIVGNSGKTSRSSTMVPNGKIPVTVKGQVVGYADDNKGTNYTSFKQ